MILVNHTVFCFSDVESLNFEKLCNGQVVEFDLRVEDNELFELYDHRLRSD
jgi:hypothetical protein